MTNSQVYDAVDNMDSDENYLRMTYKALTPYLAINKLNFNIHNENHGLKVNTGY
ncbi:hypothetical protein MBCUT_13250 [Methanobrevibacter cuticularis]|uniref:Uncharacterized protein n=1 Tax=Methanobrevibacter cuticularis TaxID=47311 RepID=A0A166DL90_9EURY|nr:hypothetical protein [Methanobrevibacter cuticularis]KZX15714.1 hypothetical protein MBCUT_13250 [Methanobrevibacter cuticularis]